jgi:hypothetical protein
VTDINFRSLKLALGIGVIISAILLFSYGFSISAIFPKKRVSTGPRKITMKKPPLASVPIKQLRGEKSLEASHAVSPGDESRLDKSVKDNMMLSSAED